MSNRTDTVRLLQELRGGTLKANSELLDLVVDVLAIRLAESGEVVLPNFGRLKVQTRPARTGRNPRTGEVVQIPEKDVVKFRQFSGFDFSHFYRSVVSEQETPEEVNLGTIESAIQAQ